MLVQWVRSGSDPSDSQLLSAGFETKIDDATATGHSRSVLSTETEVAAFHWQQLDSPDFVTYVANLRRIGCPEATIRDIVDGELREIYAQRANGEGGATGSVYASMSDAAFPLDSEAERLSILSTLLSGGSASGSLATVLDGTDGVATALPGSEGKSAGEASVTATFAQVIDQVPAAFRVGNEAAGGSVIDELVVEVTDSRLDLETAGQISRMRQDFADAVKGGSESGEPTSQDYFKQWMKAKRDSDDRFSSMYGGDAMDALYRQSMLDAGKTTAQPPSN